MAKFNFIKTGIDGVLIVEPTVFGDQRGFFMETFSSVEFIEAGITDAFVQQNHSRSAAGVLRGLHFQYQCPQGKLIRVASGSVYDVVVDLRHGSLTYGQHVAVLLSATNKRQLYVPPGFAHGFLCLEDGTDFLYSCTEYYHPEYDSGLLWNDPALGIDWRLTEFGFNDQTLVLSAKDQVQPTLANVVKID